MQKPRKAGFGILFIFFTCFGKIFTGIMDSQESILLMLPLFFITMKVGNIAFSWN